MRSEKASDHGYHWAQPRRHTPGIGVRPRHPPLGDNRQSHFCRIWRNFWHPGGIPVTMQEIPPQIPTLIP